MRELLVIVKVCMTLVQQDGYHDMLVTNIVHCHYNWIELLITSCLRVSIAVKRHHAMTTLIKENHLIEVAYIFRDLVHYHHGVAWCRAGRHGPGEVAESPSS